MALTELQLPNKVTFYARLQAAATGMNQMIHEWRNLAKFIGIVETADLDTMGVATGNVRTDLIDFRTAINEMISLYDGNEVTPTVTASAVIDKIRRM